MKLTLASVLRALFAACRDPKVAGAIVSAGGPVAGLILAFGLEPLESILADLTAPEITDEMVREALAKKGLRVTPIDLDHLYGGAA